MADGTGSDEGDAAGSLRGGHPTERAVGVAHYVSDVDGLGGRLRDRPEDFRVRERERVAAEPLDADPDAYPHVVLRATLRDWDTNDFASVLSDRLGVSRERVHWAGTKDKRAVTTQLFSVDRVDPEDLAAVSLDGVEIDLVGRFGRSVELGDLAGNEFAVTVAGVERPAQVGPITAALCRFAGGADPSRDGEDADDQATAEAIRDRLADGEAVTVGVPNYFGQQRFGSRRPISHDVGLAIVRGDWRDAVRTYVAVAHEGEPASTREAREEAGACFDRGDFRGALEALPDRLGYERALCHALVEQASGTEPSDGAGRSADAQPSRGTGRRDGTEPGGGAEEGSGAATAEPDYRAALDALPRNLQRLFVHAAQSYAFNRMLSERLSRGLPFDRPVEGDVVCFADVDAPADVRLPDTDRLQRVDEDRVDTVARHCERGRAFVTAPLVGTETALGDGEPGAIERAVLADLGLEPGDFALPEPYDSTGTRRAILVQTDLGVGDVGTATPTFEFALPKGAYATVLLREYLKVDPVEMG